MKSKFVLFGLLLILPVAIGILSCNKSNEAPPPPELPPYSETGANTFGCIVNGQLFMPKGKDFSMILPLSCTYQMINDTPVLSIGASDLINNQDVNIGMNRIWINRDTIIPFKKRALQSLTATFVARDTKSVRYETQDSTLGELNVQYFNPKQKIISGTFWFDAVNVATGEKVAVRDGRFDLKYSQ